MFSRAAVNDLTDKDNSSRKILYGAFLLYFLYPFFRDILPLNDAFWLLSIMAGLFVCIYKFNIEMVIPPTSICWAAIAMLSLGAFLILGPDKTVLPKRMGLFLVSMFMMIMLSKDRKWIQPALLACLTLLSVHAFATIVLNAFPGLYTRLISPVIQGSSVTVIGPKAGLTSHYSYNGQLVSIGLLISYVLYKTSPLKNGRKHDRARYGILTVVFAAALLLTTKRAPLLICVAAILLTEYMMSSKGKALTFYKVLCALFILGIIVITFGDQIPIISNIMDRLSEFFTTNSLEEGTTGRTLLWDRAIQLWKESPIFGHGWGTYRYDWVNGYQGESTAAHNVFLQLLSEVGIVGFIVFLIPFIYVLFSLTRRAYRLTRRNVGDNNPAERYDATDAAILFAFLFQFYFFAYCFVGAPLYDFESFPVYFVLSCGVLYSTAISSDEQITSHALNN